jgi:hypothetical protein
MLLLTFIAAGCGGAGGSMVGEGMGRQFAGAVSGSDAFLAVVGNDTRVNAYLCDGATTVTLAEWMSGDVVGGAFTATSDGAGGFMVAGTYAEGRATGTLTLDDGSTLPFDIAASPGDVAGLHRGSAEMGDQTLEAGIIIDGAGDQKGAIGIRRTGVMADPMMVIPTPMIMPDPMGVTSVTTTIGGTSITIRLTEALNADARF